jgi:hypothetical protein
MGREVKVDGKRAAPAANRGSVGIEGAVPDNMFRQLREVLNAQDGEGLSARAEDVLHEVCSEARRCGVPPEQLAARVNEEFRSTSRFANDRDYERRRMAEAVAHCIQSFFATSRQQS